MSSKPNAKAPTIIRYPRFNQLHNDIHLCLEATKQSGEPACMALEGLSGAGKSTLVRAYAANFPRYETESGTRVPIFYLETPSPVTVKGMASHMLAELGDPGSHKGTLQMMNARLIRYLRACEVQLVILDDFHHLIDRETNKILARVSDWLKVLIKETGIPYLVVGIENSVETILRANQQLSRLFAIRESLQPFTFENEEDAKSFALFLEYAQQTVGMAIETEMSDFELLARLHYATNGVVGNIMNLLRFAALLARRQDEKAISVMILDQAFNKRLQRHVLKEANPFTIGIDTVLKTFTTSRIDGAGNRSRRRKHRSPKVSEVLSKK
ncbi:MAG: TniB family NTP-binding protein [Anaerolineales bacterium]|nr:TniB family NTP-binding protein [Anaerolineales bacterium]